MGHDCSGIEIPTAFEEQWRAQESDGLGMDAGVTMRGGHYGRFACRKGGV